MFSILPGVHDQLSVASNRQVGHDNRYTLALSLFGVAFMLNSRKDGKCSRRFGLREGCSGGKVGESIECDDTV